MTYVIWFISILVIAVLLNLDRKRQAKYIDEMANSIKETARTNEERNSQQIEILNQRYLSLARMLGSDINGEEIRCDENDGN